MEENILKQFESGRGYLDFLNENTCLLPFATVFPSEHDPGGKKQPPQVS
jgi:hypothetical protein